MKYVLIAGGTGPSYSGGDTRLLALPVVDAVFEAEWAPAGTPPERK